MTKKIFLLQFSLILLIFVFPPIFVKNGQNAALDLSKFNFFVLLNFCAALLLLAQKRMEERQKAKDAETVASPRGGGEPKTAARLGSAAEIKLFASQKGAAALWRAAIFSSRVLVCYGALLLLGILFFVAQRFFQNDAALTVELPQNVLGWLACAFALFAAALFEETIYRWYLPHALATIASAGGQTDKSPRAKEAAASGENVASLKSAAKPEPFASQRRARLAFWGTEAACVVLFALAHRWQGALAVLNALFGGIILRLCAVKSKGLAPGIAAHFLYNASALLFAL